MTSLFNEVVPQPDVILIMTKYSARSKNYPSPLKFCLYKNILQWVKIGQQAKVLDMKPDTLVNPDDLSLTSRANVARENGWPQFSPPHVCRCPSTPVNTHRINKEIKLNKLIL